MKIVLLVTSPGDLMCGVADYTEKLAQAFDDIGVEAILDRPASWNAGEIARIRRVHGGADTVLHLQYPSLTMSNSLAPAMLPIVAPNIYATLHEFRLFSLPRKLIFAPFALRARALVFSNPAERDGFRRAFPFGGASLRVLPIGNNIHKVDDAVERRERLVYFGQISRNKGIEIFLDTISTLRRQGAPLECRMIGAMVEGDGEFRAMVERRAAELDVSLRLNMPPDDVSRELLAATIALLPFPDGVSDKRGSALACLDHGVSVLTTQSQTTPAWLKQTTLPITDPDDAAAAIARLLAGNADRHPGADVLAREMKARDWREIARAHLALYRDTMR
ncbi:glycosyltransferase involved in cell wall biosynthesis [Rhizobium sp. SG_E_25_P2]|uniref:glycosyltransferase n=1 Tax=Rhizobium sp. SG_E_25_P2 TaxID=2879942 RepID=UPI002477235B|nr:glycosyltransferase [Rhizobium sp. SG_E_25_P2]MDH6264749.1 glycosyltransferase involved in cell wall biosynthesis [Rhizobium sp. SG_E_25_P2]